MVFLKKQQPIQSSIILFNLTFFMETESINAFTGKTETDLTLIVLVRVG
jgi:hypothetical protein